MGGSPRPVWVHIATTQRVVELGFRKMLEAASTPFDITSDASIPGEPDVVLFDVIHLQEGDLSDLERWLMDTATTVIAIDRTLRPELGTLAREHGVEWGIDLGIEEHELTRVVAEAATGTLEDSDIAQEWTSDTYPGEDAGLSPRESDIIRRIVIGHTNQEIAGELYLSINSIKTYIRSAYRKIDATSRSQAVIWGLQHGFPTEPTDPTEPYESRVHL